MGHGIILSIPNTLLPRSNALTEREKSAITCRTLNCTSSPMPYALCPMPHAPFPKSSVLAKKALKYVKYIAVFTLVAAKAKKVYD